MEIIVAICALILGLLAGFFFGRTSAPKADQSLLLQQEENHKREIENIRSANNDFIERIEKNHNETIENLENKNKEAIETLERKHKENIESVESKHREVVESLEEKNRQAIESLERKHKETIDNIEKNRQESLQVLKEQFCESSNAMSERLRSTTEEMLKQRQEEFSTSSGEKIGAILEPLKLSLKVMQEKVAENTDRHTKLGGELSASIRNLLDHTEAAQASAEKLSSMLRGSSRHQGEWGEIVLKEILESLNLREGVHFDVQQTITDEKGKILKNEEGNAARPDIILHLDRDKDVIIDSKVSLSAYLQYHEAETEEERQEALRKHIRSLENHVGELVRKDYSSYIKKPRVALGYVIMFVPNTSALLLATKSKPTLWRDAMEKNVYIADEQTLYAALKIVSITWQQIQQNASHAKVFELAEKMIQRVAVFMKAYNDMGEQLSKATKSFEEGQKKLEEGGQSIPQVCRKLIDLGAKRPKLPKGVDPSLFGSEEEIETEEG